MQFHMAKTGARPGIAAATLAFLVTLSLMGQANAAYRCSTRDDCNYKGCNDIACSSGSPYCNNGIWEYRCDDDWGVTLNQCGYGEDGDPTPEVDRLCPEPPACAAGKYSQGGKKEQEHQLA